jgi:hypothetical protein
MGSIPDYVIAFLTLPNPSSRTMALGLTKPLTEMSSKNLPGVKVWQARKADNLTANCGADRLENVDVSQPPGPRWPVKV